MQSSHVGKFHAVKCPQDVNTSDGESAVLFEMAVNRERSEEVIQCISMLIGKVDSVFVRWDYCPTQPFSAPASSDSSCISFPQDLSIVPLISPLACSDLLLRLPTRHRNEYEW